MLYYSAKDVGDWQLCWQDIASFGTFVLGDNTTVMRILDLSSRRNAHNTCNMTRLMCLYLAVIQHHYAHSVQADGAINTFHDNFFIYVPNILLDFK